MSKYERAEGPHSVEIWTSLLAERAASYLHRTACREDCFVNLVVNQSDPNYLVNVVENYSEVVHDNGASHRPTRSWLRPLIAAFCLLLLAGCSRDKSLPSTSLDGISRETRRGPIDVLVAVDRKAPTIADRLMFSITVTVDEDYDFDFPPFGEKLDEFGIVAVVTSEPVLKDDGRLERVRTYTLEPFLSGEYTIPSMAIDFWKRGSGDTDRKVVESEPIELTVASLLPADVQDRERHDIQGPVSLPQSLTPLWWTLGSLLGIALLIVILVILVRRRGQNGKEILAKEPPHEVALRALEALLEQDLLAQGKLKALYQGVSDILRRYIEDRFGLRAPEQTTEEFLPSLASAREFPTRFQPLLETFLSHCDLVKFAEHQPEKAEIDRTVDSCRAFIAGTIKKDEGALRDVSG